MWYSRCYVFLGDVYLEEKKVSEALDWLCKAMVRGSLSAYKRAEELIQEDAMKLQIEKRLSVYFKEIYGKDENDNHENCFLGWCHYAGVCCKKSRDFAGLYWAAAVDNGDVYCKILLEDLEGKNRTQKYSQYEMKQIFDIILAYCDKISQVSYCKAYKFALGEKVPIKLLNNVLSKIGQGKYVYPSLEKEQILVIVSEESGKVGMVFALNGVYYKAGAFRNTEYRNYEECHSVNSFYNLSMDSKFSCELLDEMFFKIQVVLGV